MIEIVFYFFGTFLIAILTHELGHYLYFKMGVKHNIRIYFNYKNFRNFGFKAGTIEDYKNLTDQQYAGVNFLGVFMGFIPIFLSSIFLGSTLILLVLPYTWGCIEDIVEFSKSVHFEEEIDLEE